MELRKQVTLPKIVVITQNPNHRAFLQSHLSYYYNLHTYHSIPDVLNDGDINKFDIVLIDQNGRRDNNIDTFIEITEKSTGKNPALVIIASKDVGHDVDDENLQTPLHVFKLAL